MINHKLHKLLKTGFIFLCSASMPLQTHAAVIDVYPEYYEEDGGVVVIEEEDDYYEEQTRPEPTTEEDIPSFTWEEVTEPEPTIPPETLPPETSPPETSPPETLPPETSPAETQAPETSPQATTQAETKATQPSVSGTETKAPQTSEAPTEAQTKAPETKTQSTESAKPTTEAAPTQPSAETKESKPSETETSEAETSPPESSIEETSEAETKQTEEQKPEETLPAETSEEKKPRQKGNITIIGAETQEGTEQHEDYDLISVTLDVAEGTDLPLTVSLLNEFDIQSKYAVNEMSQKILIRPGTYQVTKVVDGRGKYLKSGMSFTVTPKTKSLFFDFRKTDGSLKDRIIVLFRTNAWILVMGFILFGGFVLYRKIFYDEEGD